jgi:hypothetical protein
MGHWRQFLDRETMGAWDLGDKDRVVRIDRVTSVNMEARGGIAAGRKAMIRFTPNSKGIALKPMIAGATVLAQIAAVLGEDDPAKWTGQRIILYPTKDRGAKGGQVDCIRVRPRLPAASAPTTDDGLSRPVDEAMRANQKAQAGGDSPSGSVIATSVERGDAYEGSNE